MSGSRLFVFLGESRFWKIRSWETGFSIGFGKKLVPEKSLGFRNFSLEKKASVSVSENLVQEKSLYFSLGQKFGFVSQCTPYNFSLL